MSKASATKGNKGGKRTPVTPGMVFTMPLEDGRFGACRVVAPSSSARSVVAEASSWVGKKPAKLADVLPWKTLVLTHHAFDKKVERAHVDHLAPEDFKPIGTMDLTPQEQSLTCPTYGDWESFQRQALRQWRWDNEHDKVLEEDAAKEAAKEAVAEQARAAESVRQAELSFAVLKKSRPFAAWKGSVPNAVIPKAQALLTHCIERLEKLGADAKKREKTAALKELIVGFNELNKANDAWIGKAEGELIDTVFNDVVAASGLDPEEKVADKWRDW